MLQEHYVQLNGKQVFFFSNNFKTKKKIVQKHRNHRESTNQTLLFFSLIKYNYFVSILVLVAEIHAYYKESVELIVFFSLKICLKDNTVSV